MVVGNVSHRHMRVCVLLKIYSHFTCARFNYHVIIFRTFLFTHAAHAHIELLSSYALSVFTLYTMPLFLLLLLLLLFDKITIGKNFIN